MSVIFDSVFWILQVWWKTYFVREVSALSAYVDGLLFQVEAAWALGKQEHLRPVEPVQNFYLGRDGFQEVEDDQRVLGVSLTC